MGCLFAPDRHQRQQQLDSRRLPNRYATRRRNVDILDPPAHDAALQKPPTGPDSLCEPHRELILKKLEQNQENMVDNLKLKIEGKQEKNYTYPKSDSALQVGTLPYSSL